MDAGMVRKRLVELRGSVRHRDGTCAWCGAIHDEDAWEIREETRTVRGTTSGGLRVPYANQVSTGRWILLCPTCGHEEAFRVAPEGTAKEG